MSNICGDDRTTMGKIWSFIWRLIIAPIGFIYFIFWLITKLLSYPARAILWIEDKLS